MLLEALFYKGLAGNVSAAKAALALFDRVELEPGPRLAAPSFFPPIKKARAGPLP